MFGRDGVEREAWAVVADFETQSIGFAPRGYVDAGTLCALAYDVLDDIFNQRLQSERRDLRILEGFRDFNGVAQARAVARALDFEIIADDFDLLRERHKATAMRVEREAQQGYELAHGVFGAFGIERNERGDRVERVEQEVRLNARLKRRQARFGQEFVGALLFHLARTQLDGGEVQPMTHGFVRRDGQTGSKRHDKGDRIGAAKFIPEQVAGNNVDHDDDEATRQAADDRCEQQNHSIEHDNETW